MTIASPLVELRGVTKTFGDTRALDRVDLRIGAGEVVALMGENGAGKSTLMKILSGVWPHASFSGQILVGGQTAQFRDTRDAHCAGIAMIHQELSVFPELTVAEHFELDRLPTLIRWSTLFDRAQAFLDRLGFAVRADSRVAELSIGQRQLVEIAAAIYRNARVLVFDEPTSALSAAETARLFTTIQDLRTQGRGIVYISHRMDEIFHLADRAVVLRDGKSAGEMPIAASDRAVREPELIRWMVGRELQDIYPARNPVAEDAPVSLRVDSLNLSIGGSKRVDALSFNVRRGEVVGLSGLMGAGRSETLLALFGGYGGQGPLATRDATVSGRVWVDGRLSPLTDPRSATRAGLALVTEDRKATGLVLQHGILSNFGLPGMTMQKGSPLAGTARAETRKSFDHWARSLRIKHRSSEQPVAELSGGNQQKVVLAKWLKLAPRVLLLDEPTRGVDVGAKAEIYSLIQSLAAQGLAIVVASSEMPELLGLCHRILVLRSGRLSAEFRSEDVTQEQLLKAASP